MMGKRGRRLTT